MAENTRLKDLSTDIKRMLELMESHHTEYSSRFESIETALTALHVAETLKSSTSEAVQTFQFRNVKLDFPSSMVQMCWNGSLGQNNFSRFTILRRSNVLPLLQFIWNQR